MRLAITSTVLALLFAVSQPASAETSTQDKKSLRKEVRQLKRELRDRPLRTREDIRYAYVQKGTVLSETQDGQRWAHADEGVAFEALSYVTIEELRLRKGDRLLVRVGPPVTWGRTSRGSQSEAAADTAPAYSNPRGAENESGSRNPILSPSNNAMRWIFLELELTDSSSVKDRLAAFFYMDGAEPSEAEVQACLDRYPEQDERLSQARCEAATLP